MKNVRDTDVGGAGKNGYKAEKTENLKKTTTTKTTTSNQTAENIVIGLSVSVLILAFVVIAYFLYRSRKNQFRYQKVNTEPVSTASTNLHKPKLTINLPQLSEDNQVLDSPQNELTTENHLTINAPKPMVTPPLTPATPMTPLSPFSPSVVNIQKTSLKKSVSLPVKGVYQAKDINADGLWRNAVRKATNSQFLQTEPKPNKFSYCASGKIKFSLTYDVQNQKELTVKVSETFSRLSEIC